MTDANVLRVIDRVKNIIDTFGWVKGMYGTCEEGFCLQGAFFYNNDNSISFNDNYYATKEILRRIQVAFSNRAPQRKWLSIPEFNDHITTGRRDIDFVLDNSNWV